MDKRNLKRVFEVIQSDKAVMSDGCRALVEQDLTRKFSEYFDLTKEIELEVVCENGIYRITARCEAERVKKFNVLK
ncbi:MAG: hypothetical protein IJX81_02660 [Clostridia bacterium]|nr:hypothetical protein [Clostridia bacterium]